MRHEPIDDKLTQFATVRQLEIMEAVNAGKSFRAAAKLLGIAERNVAEAISRIKKKAAAAGYSPEHDMTRTAPIGFGVRGTSTLYNKDGAITSQWVKTQRDEAQQQAAMRAAFEALSEELPRATPTVFSGTASADLCNVFTLTDSHVGAMCWREEGGADWDLKIAERTLVGCFEKMIQASPSAEVGIVAQLGDFLHADGIMPVTPTSGHILDADGRFSKVVKVAIRILRTVVDMTLAKHEKVVVLMAEGNHDITSSIWLRTMFAALYENEPRVQVIDTPLPYYTYQHGLTMLAWHHGHLKKNDGLPILFASQFPVMWGATTKRYAHCGHRHHVEEKEHSGMHVIQHATLAARDAYAARGGWLAEREVTAMTYHSKYGRHSRVTICPEMIEL